MTAEQNVRAWLRERGADGIDHVGGSLYAHLSRVHGRLALLGLDSDVQLAGLTHAVYGTDGFDVALLDRSDRETLRDLVGPVAEVLVYRYGACDRRRTWRRLSDTRELRDRFTGAVETLGPTQLRPFVDLSIVNELDVIEQDPTTAGQHGAYLRTLFTSWARIASGQVTSEAQRVLGPSR